MRLLAIAFASVVALALAGCPPTPPGPDGGTPAVPDAFTVGPVEVVRAPFALVVRDGDTVVAESARDADGCAPLMAAVRPDDDEGAFFAPEQPSTSLTWVTSGDATLVSEDPLTLDVALSDGEHARVVVRAGAQGFVDVDVSFSHNPRALAMVGACLSRTPGEHAVGGGERFTGVDVGGTVVPLQFRAPGTFASGTNEAHVPVPFFATTSGLAVLVESERVGALDLGATDPATHRVRLHGATLPLRVRAGALVENVKAHARRMGLPPRPPSWALAPQQWRNEHAVSVDDAGVITSTGRDRFEEDARTLRALDIPTTTLWVDAPWQTGYNTFTPNEVQFPGFAAMIAEAEAAGFRVIVWATEHVNSSNDEGQQVGMPAFGAKEMYDTFAAAGHLVKTPDGDVFVFPWARGSGGSVDFTSEAARLAYQERMTPLLELGVRGFKLDFGETMRPDILGAVPNAAVAFADGTTTEVQHVRYGRLYHETFRDALAAIHPDDHFIITRSGGIFDQRNGFAIWPGDLDNDFARAGDVDDEGGTAVGGLPAAIAGALSLAMSGYPLSGSDIGGYRGGPPTTEVLLRWAQFGALQPIMQLGGGGTGDSTHNPWDPLYDAIAVEVYRRYAKLHMSLVPTFESALRRASTDGTPVMLPLGAFDPDDEELWVDGDAFVVAGDLLVAPVVVADATEREIAFPDGAWLDWWTGELVLGPKRSTVPAPLDVLPLFLRAGAVVALYPDTLDTLVESADPDVVDPSAIDGALEVRTSAGPASGRTLVDESSLSQATVDGRTTVVFDGALPRALTVRFVPRPDHGPGVTAPVVVNGAPVIPVDAAAFAGCAAPCAAVVDGELRVRTAAARAVVEIGP